MAGPDFQDSDSSSSSSDESSGLERAGEINDGDSDSESSSSDEALGLERTEEINDGDSSTEESSSDDGDLIPGFLDMEAAESDSSDSESEVSVAAEHSFPQFGRLPTELRQRVWEFFDPHMLGPRVFSFQLVQVRATDRGNTYAIWEDPTLEQQTQPARTLLAICHESRSFARRKYPHTLPLPESAHIPCHHFRDIVRIVGPPDELYNQDWNATLAPVIEDFLQVALHLPAGDQDTPEVSPAEEAFMSDQIRRHLFPNFPSLRSVYKCSDEVDCQAKDIQWCALDSTNKFHVQTSRTEPDEEDVQFMFCWPQISGGIRLAAHAFMDDPTRQYLGMLPPVDQLDEGKGLSRMIQFTFDSGMERFHKIREATFNGTFDNYESSDDSDVESEENEYESSGIDDESIDDDMESDSEEDDLAVRDSSPVDLRSPFERTSSSMERALGGPLDAADLGGANFSDVESASSETADEGSSDADDVQPRAATSRQPRVIEDSSDETDEDDEPVPAQDTNRKRPRAQVVDSDSEDDGESSQPVKRARTAGRKLRAVLSESEDEDDSENDEALQSAITKTHPRKSVRQEDSESEDEFGSQTSSEESSDEDEEGEEPAPKQMSLAERIGAFRAEIPAGNEAESSSEAEYDEFNDEGEDGYGGTGYGAFQDDEDGEGQSDPDEMVMNMDEEMSEGDEDGW
ncbi:hypothetical protein BJ166DRAFT_510818 [Pestalotiopsis sp. NC0098]|nr:hypothetical protein BJ166DRAFT_510818 [Pestalotiopsis sp. NC0098]